MGEGYRGKRHRGTDGPQRLTASKAHSEVLSAENWGTPMPQKNKEEVDSSGEEDTRKKKVKRKCSVVSNSLRPQGPYPTRLLRPWDSPGKSAAVGCHFLLQGRKMRRLILVENARLVF